MQHGASHARAVKSPPGGEKLEGLHGLPSLPTPEKSPATAIHAEAAVAGGVASTWDRVVGSLPFFLIGGPTVLLAMSPQRLSALGSSCLAVAATGPLGILISIFTLASYAIFAVPLIATFGGIAAWALVRSGCPHFERKLPETHPTSALSGFFPRPAREAPRA